MNAEEVTTLTQLRKEIGLQEAANIRQIMAMFQHIAKNNPDAVKASFGAYLKRSSEASQNAQVEWYADQAEYFKILFDLN